jgi:hypothetical protein
MEIGGLNQHACDAIARITRQQPRFRHSPH